MDITHEITKRKFSQATTIVWGAVAILIVVSILALAVLWAMGVWPVAVDQNGSARGLDADAERYSALGQYHVARGAEADAARWAALGQSYGSRRDAQRYTDVSLFYAERMRAQAREKAALIANPELMLARRSYASENALAANPELMLARRAYGTSGAVAGDLAPVAASTSSAGDTPTCSLEERVATEGIVFWRSERGC